VNSTGFLSFEVDLEPIITTLSIAKRGEFDCGLTNKVTIDDIFVENFKMHIVSDVFYIDNEKLIRPFGIFAGVLHGLGAYALLSSVNNNIGIHLAEGFSIAR
jgi:hypothetical protein